MLFAGQQPLASPGSSTQGRLRGVGKRGHHLSSCHHLMSSALGGNKEEMGKTSLGVFPPPCLVPSVCVCLYICLSPPDTPPSSCHSPDTLSECCQTPDWLRHNLIQKDLP